MDVQRLLRMIAHDPLVLSATVLLAFATAILVGFLITQLRRRRAHDHAHDRETIVPLVVFAPRAHTDGGSAAAPIIPRPRHDLDSHTPFPSAPAYTPPGSYTPPAAAYTPPSNPAYAPLPYGNGNGSGVPAGDGESRPGLVEGKTIRFYRPPEGTLQMLPGRLEIVEGEDRGQAIRFVRTRGGLQQVTFGRREGAPYEHIQLRAPTVSRQHARLDFEHGHWNIYNLSETNPVLVNGESLAAGHGVRPLSDGDRIEMGEVVFRFRER
jgi:hypothetical protein